MSSYAVARQKGTLARLQRSAQVAPQDATEHLMGNVSKLVGICKLRASLLGILVTHSANEQMQDSDVCEHVLWATVTFFGS